MNWILIVVALWGNPVSTPAGFDFATEAACRAAAAQLQAERDAHLARAFKPLLTVCVERGGQ